MSTDKLNWIPLLPLHKVQSAMTNKQCWWEMRQQSLWGTVKMTFDYLNIKSTHIDIWVQLCHSQSMNLCVRAKRVFCQITVFLTSDHWKTPKSIIYNQFILSPSEHLCGIWRNSLRTTFKLLNTTFFILICNRPEQEQLLPTTIYNGRNKPSILVCHHYTGPVITRAKSPGNSIMTTLCWTHCSVTITHGAYQTNRIDSSSRKTHTLCFTHKQYKISTVLHEKINK